MELLKREIQQLQNVKKEQEGLLEDIKQVLSSYMSFQQQIRDYTKFIGISVLIFVGFICR